MVAGLAGYPANNDGNTESAIRDDSGPFGEVVLSSASSSVPCVQSSSPPDSLSIARGL